MRVVWIAVLVLCLACSFGCNKNKADKTAQAEVNQDPTGQEEIEERVEEQSKPDESQGGGRAQADDIAGEGLSFLKPEEAQKLRDDLIAMAPDYDLEYIADTDSIAPKGKSAGGMSISAIVEKIDSRMKMQAGQPGEIPMEEFTRRILQNLQSWSQPGGEPVGGAQQQTEGQQAEVPPAGEMLVTAKRVWGEWRSIREEGPRHSVDHSDQYFDFMNLWYDGNRAEFRQIRDGKLFSVDEFKFAFDAANGELIILDPETRKELRKMICYENANEKDKLVVSSDGGRTKTIYVKVGRGGAPLTPEEQAIQDKASGFGQEN